MIEEAYTLLENEEIVLSQSIGLGDDRDEVNTGTESLHNLNIKRLQAEPSPCQNLYTNMNSNVLTYVPWA